MNEIINNSTSLFEELCLGINQAIEFTLGTGNAKITTCFTKSISEYKNTTKRINKHHILKLKRGVKS